VAVIVAGVADVAHLARNNTPDSPINPTDPTSQAIIPLLKALGKAHVRVGVAILAVAGAVPLS
jgi:hypothetical protein